MRTALIASLLLLLVGATACAGRASDPDPAATSAPSIQLEPGNHDREIDVDGETRRYVLHVPAGYDGSGPRPLVLVYHGGGGNAANAERMSGFTPVSDREGFFLVYPEGSGRLANALHTWNAGNCCGYALEEEVDDVAFARALVEDLVAELPVDARRIYVTGMSNGGMMSYRLACEMADVLAAAAPIAGALNVPDCAPAEPISIVAFHGTADQSVRYEGGEPIVQADRNARVDTSVADSVGAFVESNGCSPNADRGEAGALITESWGECDAGIAVVLYTISGGGHSWPGGQPGFADADNPSDAIDATEVIWAFFEAHPEP